MNWCYPAWPRTPRIDRSPRENCRFGWPRWRARAPGPRTGRGSVDSAWHRLRLPPHRDIEGVARVVLNLTLRNVGTPQVEGRVFGETTFLVTKFFGRTDLTGTFEGSFNGSLDKVRFGAAKIT